MINNTLCRIILLMLTLTAVPSLRAQSNDCDETYLSAINSALDKGDCEMARRYYNAYVACRGNRIDPTIERRIQECLSPKQKLPPKHLTVEVNNMEFKMIFVEGGTFTMGCTGTKADGCADNARPAHKVTLDDFFIGETEVTQALWCAVMGADTDDRWFTPVGVGDDYPVYNVSYGEVQAFISKLNEMTGYTFRLPTEAEWEYAARGGRKSRGFKYSGSNALEEVAWNILNSETGSHSVKCLRPNELGIYDMSGNVWEMCGDGWYEYESKAQMNPSYPIEIVYYDESGENYYVKDIVCRGGSYGERQARKSLLVTTRDTISDGRILGFRLSLSR